MNRSDRLTGILLLLQDRPHTAGEIAEHFEICRRTVLRDIQALCEIGAPVIARPGGGGGYSLPPDYAIPVPSLSVHEALLLMLAAESIEKVADVPFARARPSLLAKLRALIPERARAADRLRPYISMEPPWRPLRAPFLEALVDAARDGAWVRAEYRSQRRDASRILQPRHLRCEGGLWYCDAYSPDHAAERTFRVDRFACVEPCEPPPNMPTERLELPYNHPAYPLVRIALTRRGAMRFEGDPHLSGWLRRNEDGGGMLEHHCPPDEYDWLTSVVLSLGSDARVLEPPCLRELVRSRAAEIVSDHSSG